MAAAALRNSRSLLRRIVTTHSTRSYKAASGSGAAHDVIDMRSDVLSRPTEEMLNAMPTATLGDDVFHEDHTTNKLQEDVAHDFGMEAALFMPSGTMGNLISVLAHCPERGGEVLLGDQSHIYLYEQGGIAQLGSLHPRSIPTFTDGTLDLSNISNYIRPLDDPHQPHTKLICVEDTHNFCGGTILPQSFLEKLRGIADDLDVPLHMDGARMMNAAVALNVEPSEVLKHVHSVNLCFSKGLGAPIGSIIAGPRKFIERAERLRKVLGGGMRQTGVLAAAAGIAYREAKNTLTKDHQHAQIVAKAVDGHTNKKVAVNLDLIHTNLVMVDTVAGELNAQMLCDRLETITEDEASELNDAVIVRSLVFSPTRVRLVLHNGVSDHDVTRAVRKINYVLTELQ